MKLIFPDDVSKTDLQKKVGEKEDASIEYVLRDDGFIYELDDSDNVIGEVIVRPGSAPHA